MFTSHSRIIGRDFTSINLLVVISIVTLLIAFLLPFLNQARKAFLQTDCLSKHRGAFMALLANASDNKDGLSSDKWDAVLCPDWTVDRSVASNRNLSLVQRRHATTIGVGSGFFDVSLQRAPLILSCSLSNRSPRTESPSTAYTSWGATGMGGFTHEMRGFNVSHIDGHAFWMTSERLGTVLAAAGAPISSGSWAFTTDLKSSNFWNRVLQRNLNIP